MMKKLPLILLFCLGVLLLNSCKKSTPADTTPDYVMTFKVDGVSQSTLLNGAIVTYTNLFTLYGSLNNQSISIALNNPAVGSYTLVNGVSSATGIFNITYLDDTTSNSYYGRDGTVTITSLSATAIAGTFQFTCATILNPAAKKTISEGKFNLKIVQGVK